MSELPKRLAPSKETLSLLFAVSGNQCAFPACKNLLINAKNKFIAQVCHIEAAAPGGERFNAQLDNEARRKPENLILLCYEHHIETNDVDTYPVEALRQMKADHEAQFRKEEDHFIPKGDFIDTLFYEELKKMEATINNIERRTETIKDDTGLLLQHTQQILDVVEASKATTREAPGTYLQEIENLMKLRESFQHLNIIHQLTQLKENNWASFSDLEKYKVLANIGVCHQELGQYTLAADYYIDAYTYQPERPRAMTLAAMGYALIDKPQEARACINRALAIDNTDIEAYLALIILEGKTLSFKELLALVPVAVRKHPRIALCLAEQARKLKELKEAITWAKIAQESEPDKTVNYQFKSVLASLVLESIHNTFDIASGQISTEAKNKANYVIQLYSEAWEYVKNTPMAPISSGWLINRGIAKTIVGDYIGYYEDSLTAVSSHATFASLQHLALAAIKCNYLDKAYATSLRMAEIAKEDEKYEVILFQAEILFLQKKYDESTQLLEGLLKKEIPRTIKIHGFLLLIELLLKAGKPQNAMQLNERLISKYPEVITAYIRRAQFAKEKQENDKEQQALIQAISFVNNATKSEDIHALAAALSYCKLYDRAIPLYESITDLTVYSPLTKELLKLYYDAGLTKKVLDNCNALILNYGPNYVLTEFLIVTYEFLSDIEKAINACKLYLEVYPDDQRISIRLALLYDKTNNIAGLKEVIDKIDNVDQTLPITIQFKVAEFCLTLRQIKKAQKLAFNSWKRNYHNQLTHECFTYISVAFNKANQIPVDPQQVQMECEVILIDDYGSKISFLITLDGKSDIPNEIAADQNIAKLLIGKEIDDQVTIADKHYKILQIRHPFNFAFSASLQLFQTKYIDSNSFRSFKLGESGDPKEDFKEFHLILDKRAKWEEGINAIHEETPLPLGVIAVVKKENPIHTWNQYLMWNTSGIQIMNGPVEFPIALMGLEEGKSILIDTITLNSIASLGLLDELAALPNKKMVAQSALNHFYDVIKEHQFNTGGIKTAGKENGNYVKQELSADQIADYLKFMEELVKWVETNCEVLPCTPALNMVAMEKEEMDGLYEKSFYESLLIAKEQNCLLYSEEQIFRAIGLEQYQLDGFNSYILATYFKSKDLITNERFNRAVQAMIEFNYKLIPVNSSILISILEKCKTISHPIFQAALQGLRSNVTNYGQCLSCCVLFYKKVIESLDLSSALKEDQSFFRDVIKSTLMVLFSNYTPTDQVYKSLMDRCRSVYSPNQPWAVELFSTIDEYYLELITKGA